jgi:predicted DNA-binding protein
MTRLLKAALMISLGQHRLVELATSAYAGLLPGWPLSNIHPLREVNTFSFRIEAGKTEHLACWRPAIAASASAQVPPPSARRGIAGGVHPPLAAGDAREHTGLDCSTRRFTAVSMVIGVRMEQEQERQLDLLARQQGKTRSACIREAIRQYLLRHGDSDEARRQSEHLAQLEPPNWSEKLPDWSDWTA